MKYAKINNDTVRVYNTLPKTWENIINFPKADQETIEAKGFYPVVEPIVTQYERLIALIPSDFDEEAKEFTHRIHNFTQQEMEEYDQAQLDQDETATKTANYIQDGEREHKRFWDYVERRRDSGDISEALYDGLAADLYDPILPIRFGAWKIAKSRVDAIIEPTNTKALEILNKAKAGIDNYILNNY